MQRIQPTRLKYTSYTSIRYNDIMAIGFNFATDRGIAELGNSASCGVASVTRKKSPNVSKGCPKMISLEKI